MQVLILMFLVSSMLLSCSERIETEAPTPVVIDEPEPIGLAFASVSSSNTRTRLDNTITQPNNATSYRDISDFKFFAFYKENSRIMSITNTEVDNLRETANKSSSRFHHFGYCDMPIGANGCLVYAKAVDESKVGVSTSTIIFLSDW